MPGPCQICGDIDLDAAFEANLTVGLLHTPLAADLRCTLGQLKASDCSKCQFFVSLLQTSTSGRWRSEPLSDDVPLCLRSFSVQTVLSDRPSPHTSVLGLVPMLPAKQNRPFGWLVVDYTGRLGHSGYIGRRLTCTKSSESSTEIPFQPREVDPAAVNIDTVKDWLTYCSSHHGHVCNADSTESIPFFRLIDCDTRTVVGMETTPPYLELSYVWGPPIPGDKFDENSETLQNIPGVIEDAIQMTRRLGYHYLWVDRFCIYQNDIEKKLQQINTMDLVYQCAQVTLIAVCNDLSLGLPGAGRTARCPQPSLEVGGSTFLSTLPNPINEIKSSVWMTRGWTFQEALFSRRRLFFTEHQVFMECHALAQSESIAESPEILEKMSQLSNAERVFPRKRIIDSLAAEPWTIQNRIDEYTQRNLTFETDTINGVLSLFRRYKPRAVAGHNGATHVWGVPILHHPSQQWTTTEGFVTALCWVMHNNAKRRPDFPSWSWAGWKGSLRAYLHHYENGFKPPYEIDVSVELVDGRVLALGAYQETLSQMRSACQPMTSMELSPILHIETWSVPVYVEYQNRSNFERYWVIKISQDEETYTCKLDVTNNNSAGSATMNPLLHERDLEAIIVGNADSPTQTKSESHMAPMLIIVAEGLVPGVVERVGVVDLDGWIPEFTKSQRERMLRPDLKYDLAPMFTGRRRKTFILS